MKLDTIASFRKRESFIRLKVIQDTRTKKIVTNEILEDKTQCLDEGSCLIRASLKTR